MKESDKQIIKNVVKECLIEILSEGILGSNTPVRKKKRNHSRKKKVNESKNKFSHLDKISYSKKKKQPKPSMNTNLTNDAVLNSLLADTAQNTLRDQIAAESRKHTAQIRTSGDAAARLVAESNPEDLFESASKWSKLAFLND
tara:strand:- start:469 stop:897 length:429 start_codon:yes stop_codon:yes gene_type:complete